MPHGEAEGRRSRTTSCTYRNRAKTDFVSLAGYGNPNADPPTEQGGQFAPHIISSYFSPRFSKSQVFFGPESENFTGFREYF